MEDQALPYALYNAYDSVIEFNLHRRPARLEITRKLNDYRKMVAAAWMQASQKKLLRKSATHWEEQAKLILTDNLEAAATTGQETEL